MQPHPMIAGILLLGFPSMLLAVLIILSFRDAIRAKRKTAGEISPIRGDPLPIIDVEKWKRMLEIPGRAVTVPNASWQDVASAAGRAIANPCCNHDGNPSHANYCRKCGTRISPHVIPYGGDSIGGGVAGD